jgi:hypothetical protein
VSTAQATEGFGAIVVVTGFLGTFAGGWLGDYWLKFSRQAYLWMSGWVTLLAVPATYLALTASSPTVFYCALVVAELLLFMSTGPINTAIVNRITRQTKVIPIVLDKAEVPEALRSLVWESVPDINDYDAPLDRIVAAIFEHREKPAIGNEGLG